VVPPRPGQCLGAGRAAVDAGVGDGHDLDVATLTPRRQVAVHGDVAEPDEAAPEHYDSPCCGSTAPSASSRMSSPARAWSSRMISGGLSRIDGEYVMATRPRRRHSW